MPRPTSRPFREAVTELAQKKILPTNATSAEIRGWDAAVRRRSFVSAQTTIEKLLDGYKERIEKIVKPVQVRRADRVTLENPEGFVTEGLNIATARLETKQLLQSMGYQPEQGKRGTIQDLSSDARVNLVLETNSQLVQGAGHFIQGNAPGVIDEFPCWEFLRFEGRESERDWKTRWKIAAQSVGDVDALRVLEETGRMIARKDSPIWQALGDGVGGYQDTLGNPFPPFAFKSGMWVQDVSYDECVSLGIPVENMQPQKADVTGAINPDSDADSDLTTIQQGFESPGEKMPTRRAA
jgi:hypothetical protein